MKKAYIKPHTQIVEVKSGPFMQYSGVYTHEVVIEKEGIDFGGVDWDGDLEASSRRSKNLWDDEDVWDNE